MNWLIVLHEMRWFEVFDWAGTVSLDAMVAFVSQSKRAILRDSQWDEMGVNQWLEQDDKGNQNSLYISVQTIFIPHHVYLISWFMASQPFHPAECSQAYHFTAYRDSLLLSPFTSRSVNTAMKSVITPHAFENRGSDNHYENNLVFPSHSLKIAEGHPWLGFKSLPFSWI